MIAIALKGRQRQVAHSYSHAEYFDRTRISRITRISHNRSSPTFGIFVKFVFNIYHTEILIEHEFRELHEYFTIALHPHSGYSGNPCSIFITRNILIEHELHELHEYFTIALHPHSGYS